MTFPYPAVTDPAADAALHIRNLAEAVDTRLSAAAIVVVPWVIDATADANGNVVTAPALSGISQVKGTVFGPMMYTTQSSDVNFQPLGSWINSNNNEVRIRCVNAPTGTNNAGKRQKLTGLAWGPRVVTAQDEPADVDALAVPPGTLFPRGKTATAKLRYPGTDEPQWRTAQAIRELAEDVTVAIGGAGPGLTIATWQSSSFKLNGVGYGEVSMAGKLSVVRGAVLTAYDPGTYIRKSRLITWYPPDVGGSPTAPNILRFIAYTNVAQGGGNTFPNFAANDTLGLMAICWGDP